MGHTRAKRLSRILLPGSIMGFSILTSVDSAKHQPDAVIFTLAYIAAGAACAAAAWLESRSPGYFPIVWVLAVGVACRAVLVPFGPVFDDDVYRYLWDGHVASHGINPFLYPPAADALSRLRFPYSGQVSYPEVGTIYPPFAQILFLLAAKLHLNTPALFKLVLVPFDLGTMALLVLMLKRLGKSPSLVLLYAWSPLVLKEFSNSAHIDVVMIFFMVLALYLTMLGRGVSAGSALALAIMTKGLGIVLAPVLALRRPMKFCVSMLIVLAALLLPYASAGSRMLGGASAYTRYWRFNDGAFYLFYRAEQAFRSTEQPEALYAKAVAAVILILYVILQARRGGKSDQQLISSCRNVVMAVLLLLPVVDPWYVCWLAPFLCLSMNKGMLALSVLCPISYLYYQNNTFPGWIRLVEYTPIYALLTWEFLNAILIQRRSRGAI